MAGLRGFLSLAVIAGAFFLLLRLLHLAVPALYPPAFAGPFVVDDHAVAARYLGFEPLLPFYRPARLGTRPVSITVTTRPHGRIVTFWQGESFLYLAEDKGGMKPAPGRVGDEIGGIPGSRFWREGRTRHAVLQLAGRWIEIRTDLTDEDVRRIVESLTPYHELL